MYTLSWPDPPGAVINPVLYTAHWTLNTIHYSLNTKHYTLHTTHFTLHTTRCTQQTTHYKLHNINSTLYKIHIKLNTPNTQYNVLNIHYMCTPIEWVAPTLCIILQYKYTNSASQRPRTAGEWTRQTGNFRIKDIPVLLWQYEETGASCICVAIWRYWRYISCCSQYEDTGANMRKYYSCLHYCSKNYTRAPCIWHTHFSGGCSTYSVVFCCI